MSEKQPYSADLLRRAAHQFLSGKLISGLLTFAVLMVLVRVLPVKVYGSYVALTATTELVYGLCGFGLPWVAARYIPECRLLASIDSLKSLIWRLLAWQAGILFAAVSVLGVFLGGILEWIDVGITVTGGVILLGLSAIEGTGRFVCEALLAPLLQQGIARASMLCRQATFLGLLVLTARNTGLTLEAVLAIELAAAGVSLLVGLAGLGLHLRSIDGNDPAQSPPLVRSTRLWRTAWPMYGADLLSMSFSPPVFLMLIQRIVGAEATAVFGFVRSLYEQAARFLPATLLFSVIRPRLIAGYVGPGGAKELIENANLAGKVSLCALMPLLAFSVAGGESLVAALSGGRFPETGLLFFGFMMVLVPLSQRQLLETVAVASGHGALCTVAAAVGATGLPAGLIALKFGAALWPGVAALGIAQLLLVLFLAFALHRLIGYRFDYSGAVRLAIAAVLAGLSSIVVSLNMQAWSGLLMVAILVLAVFLVAAWIMRPFSDSERARVKRLVGRPILM